MAVYDIADAHCDFLYEAYKNNKPFYPKIPLQDVTLQGLKKGNVKLQVFAAWTGPDLEKAEETCLRQMKIYTYFLQ